MIVKWRQGTKYSSRNNSYLYLYSLFFPRGECCSEVDGQLSNVDKGMLVRGGRVNGEQLYQAVLHELNLRQRLSTSELAVTHKCQVQFLEWDKCALN